MWSNILNTPPKDIKKKMSWSDKTGSNSIVEFDDWLEEKEDDIY